MLAGQGLELVWLADPLDAYIAHVNGSAFMRAARRRRVCAWATPATNGHEYTSLGRELVRTAS